MEKKILTLVYCSSPTEGVLFAKTFDHQTEWDAMQAAFTHVMDMAEKGTDRAWSMGDASLSHIAYREHWKGVNEEL